MGDAVESDVQLVRSAKAGDPDAASRLFERHWEGIWRTSYALLGTIEDADEVAQEAFVAALSSLDGFKGRSSFRTWLTRIAINKALNTLRQERRLTPLLEEQASLDARSPILRQDR